MMTITRLVEMNGQRRAMLGRWVLADVLGLLVVVGGIHLLAGGQAWNQASAGATFGEIATLLVTTIFLLWCQGLYAIQSKYLNLRDIVDLLKIGFVSAVLAGLFEMAQPGGRHKALLVSVLYFLAFAPTLGGLRAFHRWIEDPSRRASKTPAFGGQRCLVIGAGDAGEMVVREILRMKDPSHYLVGIVDDDPRKSYTRIHGVPVVGATSELEALVEKLDIDEIIIAVPSADGEQMRQLLNRCNRTRAHVRTLPPVRDLLNSRGVTGQIRDIDIADLLRRKPVDGDNASIVPLLEGETILITGAGGSIGSELARQAARMKPKRLILLGKGENSIFEIEQEIVREGFPTPEAVIMDVRDARSIDSLFARLRPTMVFHAAAHKHVPLMQGNPIEAVRNNVFGTISVVEAAVRHQAKHVVLVSTDKAVHPRNVMGATKRVAELVTRALTQDTHTQSSIVRFGNVLGSRGSLVPMLKAQINRGGPVRITHPDMIRFFMTIPEAVGLIFQAAALGGSGETFILDMGEPIRILDLATDLIRLSGYEPNVTMPIVFTGIRPGEKLEEELAYASETLVQTAHKKIRATQNDEPLDVGLLRRKMAELRTLCDVGDDEGVRTELMALANDIHAFGPRVPVEAAPDAMPLQ